MMEKKTSSKPGRKKKPTGQLPLLDSALTANVKDPENLRFIDENREIVSGLLSQIIEGDKLTIREDCMDLFIKLWRDRLDKYPWRKEYGEKYFERTFYPALTFAAINGWTESKDRR